jgi:hypothetical protein
MNSEMRSDTSISCFKVVYMVQIFGTLKKVISTSEADYNDQKKKRVFILVYVT